MKKSVRPIKFLPHDNKIEKTVAARRAHLIGPFTIKRLNTKRARIKAPT